MKKNDDFCPICGEFIEVIAPAWNNYPYLDDNKRLKDGSKICHPCYIIPRKYDEKLVFYDKVVRLATVQELVEDGVDSKRADKCLKAVKKLIKK